MEVWARDVYLKWFLAPVKKNQRTHRRGPPVEDPKSDKAEGAQEQAGFSICGGAASTKNETCEISVAATRGEMRGPKMSMLTIALGSTISVAIGTLAANHAMQKKNPAPTAEELQQTSAQQTGSVTPAIAIPVSHQRQTHEEALKLPHRTSGVYYGAFTGEYKHS